MAGAMPKWVKPSAAALVLALASAMGVYFEGTRHQAYPDVGGVWTICQGHTAGVHAGDTATDAECRAYLEHDMGAAYAVVRRCITVPLTISQAAAFTDAVYNLGPSVVCGSTLQKLANAGDMGAACQQLTRWVNAGGKPLPGLIDRRNAERDLCLKGLP